MKELKIQSPKLLQACRSAIPFLADSKGLFNQNLLLKLLIKVCQTPLHASCQVPSQIWTMGSRSAGLLYACRWVQTSASPQSRQGLWRLNSPWYGLTVSKYKKWHLVNG
jgi:hypothetical protein